jgi:hypothetical protein
MTTSLEDLKKQLEEQKAAEAELKSNLTKEQEKGIRIENIENILILNICSLMFVLTILVSSLDKQLVESNANLVKAQTSLDGANKTLEEGDVSLSSVRKSYEDADKKRAEELAAVNAELNEER